MELKLFPTCFFLCLLGHLCTDGNASTVLSLVPGHAGTFNVGTQNLVSLPGVVGSSQLLTTSPTVQSPYLQYVRQPSLVNVGGGVTQLFVPGQQTFLKGAGVGSVVMTNVPGVVNPTGVTTVNELGLPTSTAATALPSYTYANVNGVPVLISTAGLGLNGHQTALTALPQVGATSVPSIQPFVPQTVVGVNPVIRQVSADVEEVESPVASLVQIDPMDAALMDMENKGQIHMEKYAWGRSALNNSPKSATGAVITDSDNSKNVRADLPRIYTQLPTGSVLSSQPVELVNKNRVVAPSSTPGLTRNPFVDANGKRKKHFEFYQYFRNLNPQQVLLPPAVVQPDNFNYE